MKSKTLLCGFIVQVKTDYIQKDNAEDVETIFHTSSFEIDRLFLKEKARK